jgi:hypothetical protein
VATDIDTDTSTRRGLAAYGSLVPSVMFGYWALHAVFVVLASVAFGVVSAVDWPSSLHEAGVRFDIVAPPMPRGGQVGVVDLCARQERRGVSRSRAYRVPPAGFEPATYRLGGGCSIP